MPQFCNFPMPIFGMIGEDEVATVQDIEMEINEDSDVEMAEIPGNN